MFGYTSYNQVILELRFDNLLIATLSWNLAKFSYNMSMTVIIL